VPFERAEAAVPSDEEDSHEPRCGFGNPDVDWLGLADSYATGRSACGAIRRSGRRATIARGSGSAESCAGNGFHRCCRALPLSALSAGARADRAISRALCAHYAYRPIARRRRFSLGAADRERCQHCARLRCQAVARAASECRRILSACTDRQCVSWSCAAANHPVALGLGTGSSPASGGTVGGSNPL